MEELIDSRNEELWGDLKSRYNVSFEDSSNGEYGCYSQGDNVTFFVAKGNPCKDSFTHEMLHVYLRMHQCYIGAGLKSTFNHQSNALDAIFSTGLLEHMGNCLDHIKMLPIYLDMGFQREKFIMDYDTHKCSAAELGALKKRYKSWWRVNPTAADLFIGKLFAIVADPNDSFDYRPELEALKKVDPLLFRITMNMIDHWAEIKIEEGDILDDDYHTVLFEYHDNMVKWASKMKFVA